MKPDSTPQDPPKLGKITITVSLEDHVKDGCRFTIIERLIDNLKTTKRKSRK